MIDKPLFVLGLPRSGSTLMQRVFNADPNVLLQGEQSGAFDLIAKAYRAYYKDLHTRHSRGLSADEVAAELRTNTWIANLATWDTDRIKDLCHCLLLAVANPTGQNIRWGFKEVLFTDNVPEMILDYYPKAKIVLTTRDAAGFTASMSLKGWVSSTKEAVSTWNWRMKFIEDIHRDHPDNTFLIRYEDISNDSLHRVADWAGVSWTTATDEAVRTIVDDTPSDKELEQDVRDDVRRFRDRTQTYGA